jgi:hypothetical protein
MTLETFQVKLSILQGWVDRFAGELMEMVRTRHPEALFSGPYYWPDEGLWLIDAHVENTEDFELREQLSERETDILDDEGIWLCTLLLPLAEPSGPHSAGSQ